VTTSTLALRSHISSGNRSPRTIMPSQDEVSTVSTSVDHVEDDSSPSFRLFPQLPPETRHAIWDFVSFQERNIPIDLKYNEVPGREGYDEFFTYQYCTIFSPPAILHCTRESRTQGLKHYSLSFGRTWNFPAIGEPDGWDSFYAVSVDTPATIYVNWKADRLCLISPEQFVQPDDYFTVPFDVIETCKENGLQKLALNIDFYLEDIVLLGVQSIPEMLLFSADSDPLWFQLKEPQSSMLFSDGTDNKIFFEDEPDGDAFENLLETLESYETLTKLPHNALCPSPTLSKIDHDIELRRRASEFRDRVRRVRIRVDIVDLESQDEE